MGPTASMAVTPPAAEMVDTGVVVLDTPAELPPPGCEGLLCGGRMPFGVPAILDWPVPPMSKPNWEKSRSRLRSSSGAPSGEVVASEDPEEAAEDGVTWTMSSEEALEKEVRGRFRGLARVKFFRSRDSHKFRRLRNEIYAEVSGVTGLIYSTRTFLGWYMLIYAGKINFSFARDCKKAKEKLLFLPKMLARSLFRSTPFLVAQIFHAVNFADRIYHD